MFVKSFGEVFSDFLIVFLIKMFPEKGGPDFFLKKPFNTNSFSHPIQTSKIYSNTNKN